MPTSPDLLLCDAIVAALNAEEFSQAFAAERLYVADWDGKSELDVLQVGIWPSEVVAVPFERDAMLTTLTIGVTLAKRLAAVPIANVDALVAVADEIQAFLQLSVHDIGGGKVCVNQGWEFLLRGGDAALDRNKGADETVKYTGLFASIATFEFLLEED